MLSAAIEDYRYLLSRGYRPVSALNFVVNRYGLKEEERYTLARGVMAADKAGEIKSRLVPAGKMRNKKVAVDGYNVLITVESLLAGRALACDDTVLRDTRGVFGKYKEGPQTAKALERIIGVLAKAKPASAIFIFDSQVSRSGQLAKKVTGLLGPLGTAETDRNADRRLLREAEAGILATSDSGLLLKAKEVVDLPRAVKERFKTKEVFSTRDEV